MARGPARAEPERDLSFPLGWALASFVALRGVLSLVPWMGLWGLNVQRFLPPLEAWLPWGLAALACVPALARRGAPFLTKLGEALESRSAVALVAAGFAAAALVWLLPDRVHWVGDSLIRLGGVRAELAPQKVSPQALPLDVWLHYTLPQGLVAHGWLDADGAVRWLGAMEAAGLAALACAFAVALETSSAGRCAAAAVVFFGGYLCLLTGESKAFAEVCLVVVALAALSWRVLGGGRGLVPLGILVAVALALHRLALGFLPAFLVVWVSALRRSRLGVPSTRFALAASLAFPVAALALLGPRLWQTLVTYDLPRNFLTPEAQSGGAAASLFDPTRLLDLASALLMLSPLAVVIPFLPRGREPGATPGDEPGSDPRLQRLFWIALATPFLLAGFLARPPQGLIRDWDGLAAAGVTLSLIAAAGLATALRPARRAWLAVTVVAYAATSTISWLLHYHDPPHAVRRVEALLREPPPRPAAERSRAWDFLGWQYFQREDWDAAAVAFDSAAALGPTPRMLAQAGMAETMRKNYARARELYQRSVASDSNFTFGWKGVAVAAIWFEDLEDCERAARQLQRLAPGDPKTIEILEYLATAKRAPAAAPR